MVLLSSVRVAMLVLALTLACRQDSAVVDALGAAATRATTAAPTTTAGAAGAGATTAATTAGVDVTAKGELAALFSRGGGKYGGAAPSGAAQSVSLFGPEEKELDRYSAALAGTHFLRQERDKVIKDTTNPLAHLYLSVTKPDQHNRWMSSPWVSDKARQAQKNYLLQAGNIIRSNGLTTSRYNELSHILGKRKDIRERVQHQAYLYRVNADLRGDKIHPLVDLPETTPRRDRGDRGQQMVREAKQQQQQQQQQRKKQQQKRTQQKQQQRRPPSKSSGKMATKNSKVTSQNGKIVSKNMLFAKSLREIEALRFRQRDHLMNELGCDELPEGLCQASMERIAPSFRKACDRFPVLAESIAKANGLDTAEFNRLLARSHSNVIYRWRIAQCLRKLGGS